MDSLSTWLIEKVINRLLHLKYLAMFGILLFCGLGIPLPEEVTLVGSGVMVGWGEADFFLTSLACVLGILAGDSIIFGLGHHYGRRFLQSRPMRLLLSSRRQLKVARFFTKHGTKAVFFARFFAGVRIGVYAYAGSQRMLWRRFILLDLLGAIISGPTSIFIGKFIAERFTPMEWNGTEYVVDEDKVVKKALHAVGQFGHWLLLAAVLAIAAFVVLRILRRRKKGVPAVPLPPATVSSVVKTDHAPEAAGKLPAREEAADPSPADHRAK